MVDESPSFGGLYRIRVVCRMGAMVVKKEPLWYRKGHLTLDIVQIINRFIQTNI